MHGDLKPQNVLIGANGVLKVTDFGVARLVRNAVPERQRLVPSGEQMQIARVSGAVVGTPEYLSPELLLGESANAASDIYAAGMVLHECLTGATPFQADTPAAFMTRKMDSAMSAPARVTATLTLTRSGGEADELTSPPARDRRQNDRSRPAAASGLGRGGRETPCRPWPERAILARRPGRPGIDRGQTASQE